MQQVERIQSKKFPAESKIKSLLIFVVWSLAFTEVFNRAMHGELLGIAGFVIVQFWFTRRIWSISADAAGLKFERIAGRKHVSWAEIDDVAYNGITEEVAEVFVKGQRIRIPRGPNHRELSEIIESNAIKRISRDCHMEFATSRLAPLLQSSVSPEELKFVLATFFISFAFMAIALGWQSAIYVFVFVTLVFLPLILLYHLYCSLSRVHRVRLTQRGLGVHTMFGRYEVSWHEMSRATYEQSASQLEIRANRRIFKFGHELTNFNDLLRLIEERSNCNGK